MTDTERPDLPQRTLDPDERRRALDVRLRAAFIEGAEEDSLRRLGRGLTSEELERILRRYPGDRCRRFQDEPRSPQTTTW